ncbi:hypothetical protein V1520DRAFT_334359 [Lipomyces starkeyi]|uniref:Tr-type G domain-containing protein n=1 Tax=Lipomyces starkeyi NRRL Y-11557 TaxID=675824 RepID=A0A1E3Q4I8_LIPST|nr:hypothetical protein LIPSTDRAFT_72154 [Lipomyces starkeyi NRRL Y-11557]
MIAPELVFNHKDMPDSVLSPFSTPSPSQITESIEPEIDSHGAVEYKLHMLSPHPARLAQLTTQLQWRLAQGQGQAIYEIGVSSDGTLTGLLDNEIYGSLHTLKKMSRIVGAWFKVVRVIPIHGQEVAESDGAANRRVVEVHVFKNTVEKDVIKMFLVGATNTGKSSLLGKICYDVPDNGRGKARMKILKHRHELASGRTSSVGIEVFGYNTTRSSVASCESDDSAFEYDEKVDQYGRVIVSNYANKYTYEDIIASSSRVVMTFDTPGAGDKLGLLCRNIPLYAPDITVAAISGNGGRWTEYLDIALRATPRVAILLTKSDTFTSTDQLKALLRSILLRIATFRRDGDANVDATDKGDDDANSQHLFGKMVNSHAMAVECAANQVCVPVFLVSSVSGSGIPYLHEFLNALEPQRTTAALHKPKGDEEGEDTGTIDTSAIGHDHLIHHTSHCDCTSASGSVAAEEEFTTSPLNFFVTSVFDSGRILTGVVRSGTLMLGRTYYLGVEKSPSLSSSSSSSSFSSSDESTVSPDPTPSKRKFVKIVVRSIQKLRFPSLELLEGDIGSIGIEIVDSSCNSTSHRPFKIQKGMSVMSCPTHTKLFTNGVMIDFSAQSNTIQECKLGDMVTVFNGFERAGEIVKCVDEQDNERRRVYIKFLGSRREFVSEGQYAIVDIVGEKVSGRIVTGVQL